MNQLKDVSEAEFLLKQLAGDLSYKPSREALEIGAELSENVEARWWSKFPRSCSW